MKGLALPRKAVSQVCLFSRVIEVNIWGTEKPTQMPKKPLSGNVIVLCLGE